MANINKNITVDLPFDEDLTDKCGNTTWIISGNTTPIIKDCSDFLYAEAEEGDDPLFEKAVYFNGSNALENHSFYFGSDNFTIQFWVIFTKTSSYPFRIEKTNNSSNPFLRVSDRGIGANGNMENYSPECKLNKWYNMTFCFNFSTSKLYFYINGKLIRNISTKYDTRSLYIIKVGKSSAFCTGYIKHFRFYDSVCLYNGENFNIKETYKPIVHGFQTDTTRLTENKNYNSKLYKAFEFK